MRCLPALVLLLSACAAAAPDRHDGPPLGWAVGDVAVRFASGAELEWCETRWGCADVERRVAETVNMGLGAAVDGLAASPEAIPVRIEAEVVRFRGLRMGQAFTFGGRYDVVMRLRAVDTRSGQGVAPEQDLLLDHYGMGGIALLVAEGGQRERLAGEIARATRGWIAASARGGAAPRPQVVAAREETSSHPD